MNRFACAGLAETLRGSVQAVLGALDPEAKILWLDSFPEAPLTEVELMLVDLKLAAAQRWRADLPPLVVVAAPADEPAALAVASRLAAEWVVLPAAAELLAGRLRWACETRLAREQLTRAAQDRLNLLHVQEALIEAAAAGRDLAFILRLAADLIHARLGYTRVVVYLAAPEADDLAVGAVAGLEALRIPAEAYHLKKGVGAAGQCVVTGQVIQMPGAALLAGGEDPPELELALPMSASGRTLGALVVGAAAAVVLAAGREIALGVLADQLATLVHSRESAAREAEQAGRERLLTHISHMANSWLNSSEMLAQAIEATGRGLRADRSTLSLFDWAEGVFVTDYEHTNPMLTERRSLRRRAPLNGALVSVARALQAGEILVALEGRAHPALQEYWTWLTQRHGVCSLIWVPIRDQSTSRLYSFSLMQVTHARQWAPADIALLGGIADQLALALRNAELFDGMRQVALQLEAKNSELEAFVYTVSHDLQAPVVSMRGFASLLQSRYLERMDERGQSYLRRIMANAEYLGRLLQDLLELSRVGRQDEPDESLAVREVIDAVLLDLAPMLAERSVVLDLAQHWPVVRYARTRLRQVFSNLLTNAVKFMGPQTQPHIAVGWRSGEGAGPEGEPAVVQLGGPTGALAEFYVRDNGIGIHPDYQQRIFVPFERLKQVEVAGTGVGLSIVKRIVESRGGQVRVESEPGAGTTFYFTVPVVREMPTAEGSSDL